MQQTLAVPTEARIIVANVLSSGAAFAARMDNGENCYVPVAVSQSVGAKIGDELTAKIVPNRYTDKVERTPWLVVHLVVPAQAALPMAAVPQPVRQTMPIYDRVHAVLQGGGVWTVATMFEELFPGESRMGGADDYSAVNNALRKLFNEGKCSKFNLWRSVTQLKASKEWFTCFPERADVDEWEE